MGFAEEADCPVIIVADIDKGGVFAHLYGTLKLLSKSEQDRVVGFVINRFRGDVRLLESGLDWLEKETGKPVLGVLPYLHGLHLEAEDAIESQQFNQPDDDLLNIAVPVLTRTSNHTDFDPLRLHAGVNLQLVRKDEPIPCCDLIILPGTKNTRADLQFLRDNGWDKDIQKHLRYGGKLMGICGGYQMLGRAVHDPKGIEGASGSSEGLGYLELETTMVRTKTLKRVSGELTFPGKSSVAITGYEIHAGVTEGVALEQPLIRFSNDSDVSDGVLSDDGQVFGSYLHGIFESPKACEAILSWAGKEQSSELNYQALKEEGIERMANAVEQHLDIKKILNFSGINAEQAIS